MIKGYTLKQRERLMFEIYDKLQPKDARGVYHQFIKTYFSWPLDFPPVTEPGTGITPDGTANKVIMVRRMVYPIFSENSGPNECQSYFEDLRDQFASFFEVKYSGKSPPPQNEDDQPEHEKQKALKIHDEYSLILRQLSVCPSLLIADPKEKYIESALNRPISFVCCGTNPAHRSDIVLCTATPQPSPLLFVEIKRRYLAHFLNEDYPIREIPPHPDSHRVPDASGASRSCTS